MSEWNLKDDIANAEEDENGNVGFTGREGTIYLIDAALFENSDDFGTCLECIENDLLKNILSNPRDLVSVVFYNTKNNPPPSAQLIDNDESNTVKVENCAVFIPLKPLNKSLIQYFKSFNQPDGDYFDFTETYGISNESSFCEALWLCSRLIIRCNYRLNRSKIFLFTNNELPHLDGTKEQNNAFIRAKDLLDNHIEFELVPLVDEFDMDKFYNEFLSASSGIPQDELRYDLPADKRMQMLCRSNRPNNRKACQRHINFELADSVSLSCDIYSLTRSAHKPNSISMMRENKEVLVGTRVHFVQEANPNNADVDNQDNVESVERVRIIPREVLPGQMFKSQTICGKEILFSLEEMRAFKDIESTGLRLIGFKSLKQLKPRWMVRHCLFLYPNEKKVNGSTKLFRALWQKCLQKEKYALCTLTERRGRPPKYIALVPQTIDNDGNDGFCMIQLPVETNVGAIDAFVKPLPEVTPEQVQLAEKFCKKLRFPYAPTQFPNPALQLFYTRLEAAVYDEEEKGTLDNTMPDLERQDKQLSKDNILEHFLEEFGTEDTVSGKRSAGGQGDGTRAKAPKKDLSASDIEEAIRNGRSEAVNIQQIKDFIRSRKAHAPSGAKKANLFDFAQKLID